MPPLQPEHAMFLLHLNLGALRNESTLTRRVIEAIPLDKGDYRPDPVSKTALDLAWHIVVTERRFFESILAGEFDLTPAPRPESIQTSADIIAWYGPMFEEKTAQIAQLNADRLTKMIDFRGMFQLSAVLYLSFLMNHTIHHRGQLSMYLRPAGAEVPSIYGESYASARAKSA